MPIIIDLGAVQNWIIGGALVVCSYAAWQARKSAIACLDKIEAVRHETNSMRAALELASRAEGRLAGRQEMREETAAARATAKETKRADDIADAETHAKVVAADPSVISAPPAAIALTIAAAATEAPAPTAGVADERK